MIKGIFAAFLLLCGVVNLKSEAAGSLGWVLIIAGSALLIYQLSGSPKTRKYSKGTSGGAHHSQTNSPGDSDFSGGDGGGGD